MINCTAGKPFLPIAVSRYRSVPASSATGNDVESGAPPDEGRARSKPPETASRTTVTRYRYITPIYVIIIFHNILYYGSHSNTPVPVYG